MTIIMFYTVSDGFKLITYSGNQKIHLVKSRGQLVSGLDSEVVITIVILIILATVTINAVFGDSGLIKQTEYARDLSANATESEYEGMNKIYAEYANVMEEDKEIPIFKSEIQRAKESGEIFDNTTILEDDLENDVTIPGGFHVSDDSGTKVEEGIVIEDEIGNQFVWIPVGEYNVSTSINVAGKLTNNLSRRTFASSGATEVNEDDAINTYVYGEGNENSVAKDQIEGFKTSAITNKGYYIGRYEAGTEVERTSEEDELTIPLVQANKNAYIYVTRDQAKTQAEAMYNGNSYVTSELISSYAWDTALNFICQTNEEGYLLAITTDDIYGNIGTFEEKLTGEYETDNYSNIHDIVGNYKEWTTEYSGSYGPCILRGGSKFSKIFYSAYRYSSEISGEISNSSFRLQLYIK